MREEQDLRFRRLLRQEVLGVERKVLERLEGREHFDQVRFDGRLALLPLDETRDLVRTPQHHFARGPQHPGPLPEGKRPPGRERGPRGRDGGRRLLGVEQARPRERRPRGRIHHRAQAGSALHLPVRDPGMADGEDVGDGGGMGSGHGRFYRRTSTGPRRRLAG